MQTRVASKRSGWENSRVEIKFAGKSEIYTVGRPLDPLVLWPYLSIFFPSGGTRIATTSAISIRTKFRPRFPTGFRWKEKSKKRNNVKKEEDSFRSWHFLWKGKLRIFFLFFKGVYITSGAFLFRENYIANRRGKPPFWFLPRPISVVSQRILTLPSFRSLIRL